MAAPRPSAARPAVPRRRALDLGGRRYDLTHRALVMGILNRTPDSFYDKGATYELDKLYAPRRAACRRRRRHPRHRRGQGGPGPRSHRARGARPRRPGCRRPGGTLRHARLGRHLARRRCPRLLRRGRRDGQRHQRVWPIPTTRPAAAEHGAAVVVTHIRLEPRVADPDPHYDDVVARRGPLPLRTGGPCPGRRHPAGAHRARRRPRPRQDGRAVAGPAPRLAGAGRASATPCSSRPPTRPSSARCWIWSSPSDARLPSARRPSASPGAAASCGCTTSGAPAVPATPWPR